MSRQIDTFKWLCSYRNHLSDTVAVVATYSWSDELAMKQIKKAWLPDSSSTRKLTSREFWNLSYVRMEFLGFTRWSETSSLRLVPLWAWHCIADGEVLTCIDGSTKIKGQDEIALDIRFGCLAYGFDRRTL